MWATKEEGGAWGSSKRVGVTLKRGTETSKFVGKRVSLFILKKIVKKKKRKMQS